MISIFSVSRSIKVRKKIFWDLEKIISKDLIDSIFCHAGQLPVDPMWVLKCGDYSKNKKYQQMGMVSSILLTRHEIHKKMFRDI